MMNHLHCKQILTSPIKRDENKDSPPKKKPRITENYFKKWIQNMNYIYNNIYENKESLNIYENKNLSINNIFHLFLFQMNFETKKILNIDIHLTLSIFLSKSSIKIISLYDL
jgi:hypothetical protein